MKTLPQSAKTVVDVAMYVRMSTESQKYSIDNQEAAINAYASQHGMSVRFAYRDEGRSGLRIENRKALKSLLLDVQGGQAQFKAVLVYDVSRGGAARDAYRRQFGSLTAACRLIGHCPERTVGASEGDKTRIQTRLFFQNVADRLRLAGSAIHVNRREQYLVIDNFWQIGVVVAYERAPAFGRQSRRWRVSERNPLLDILIVVRANADRTSVRDYFVVSRRARPSFPEVLQQRNERHVEAMRTDSCDLEQRVRELLCEPPLHF